MKIELHEDEVPELEEPVTVAAGRTIRPIAAVLGAAVVVELGARPARSRRACLPEVLGPGQPSDPVGRDSDPLPPEHGNLVLAEAELRITRKHGGPEAVGGKSHVLRHEFPREIDRAVLEVVADREVAEHLEEGEMACREAHAIDVRGPEALLHGGQPWRGRRLQAQEVGLQGLHPRGGEQHGGVVGRRNERGRGQPQMLLRFEVVEEAAREARGSCAQQRL